jgi:hypothetical protein
MKTIVKRILIWALLSLSMSFFWIIAMMIGNAIFPSEIISNSGAESNGSDLWLLLICGMNTAVVLIFIYNSGIRGIRLGLILFVIIFGIQFFMAQIETVWFNSSLKMDTNTILMLVTGGLIMSLLFSFFATWVTGRFCKSEAIAPPALPQMKSLFKPVIVLAVIVWPLVYFLAGYLIAWQFAEIREYYTGSSHMESFFVMMKANITSGLYFFQIFRGLLWVLIASVVLYATDSGWLKSGLILGLLLSFLGSSQLLLPNPIMPEMVRLGHLLETSTSSFIWGLILACFLTKYFRATDQYLHASELVNSTVS